ncbi:MAG: hypothetical protein R3Y62_00010 [Eubacteriales bacterium]
MPDYQKMYTTLFNQITSVIEELQEIQQKTEEMYVIEGENDKPPLERTPNFK